MKLLTLLLVLVLATPSAHSSDAPTWETGLRGLSPEAQSRVRALCTQHARQRIYGTVDGVESIGVILAEAEVNASIVFSARLSGIQTSNLPYQFLRLGLYGVEFDSRLATRESGLPPVARFDTRTQKTSLQGERHAMVELVYRNATTPADRALGIQGRTIEIRLAETGAVLADRTEFYWFSGQDPRTSVRLAEALCPGFALSHGFLPADFIGQVVNPTSYPCMATFYRGMAAVDAEAVRLFPAAYRTNATASWSEQKIRQENALFDSLLQCESAYFRQAGPDRLLLRWNARW